MCLIKQSCVVKCIIPKYYSAHKGILPRAGARVAAKNERIKIENRVKTRVKTDGKNRCVKTDVDYVVIL